MCIQGYLTTHGGGLFAVPMAGGLFVALAGLLAGGLFADPLRHSSLEMQQSTPHIDCLKLASQSSR